MEVLRTALEMHRIVMHGVVLVQRGNATQRKSNVMTASEMLGTVKKSEGRALHCDELFSRALLRQCVVMQGDGIVKYSSALQRRSSAE